MDAQVSRILEQHLQAVKEGIAQRMASTNRNATGKSVASLSVIVKGNEGYLEGAQSFLSMERGRGPGKVPHDFVSIIRQWILAKGISYQNMIPKNGNAEQGLRRLSGAIAYSIMKRGTSLHRSQGYNDIYATLLQEELKKIEEEVSYTVELEVDKITDEFINENN